MTFIDALAACDATRLASFDHLVVIVAATMTPTLEQALGTDGAIVLRPATIKSEELRGSDLGALQEALRGRETLIFTSPINARAELRGRIRRPRTQVLSFSEDSSVPKARASARALYQRGQIEDALAAYESEVGAAVVEHDREAAHLGTLLCLIAMGRTDEGRTRAKSLRPSALPPLALLTAARVFAALSLDFEAEFTDEQAEELRAFNELRIGNVPATRPKTPDLALQAGMLLVQEKRFETAATWILSVVDEGTRHSPLGVFFAEAIATLIEEWSWNTPSDVPLRHETAAQLLSAFENVELTLSTQPLDTALRVRLLRAAFQISMRTADLTKTDRLGRRLEELGSPLPKHDDFAAAVDAAKRGDLEVATTMLGTTEPEWRGRFQKSTILFLADQHATGLATLVELANELPGVPIVEAEAARRLIAQRRYEDARRHAESAFALLPGIGQRLMLGECLLVFGENERAAELLRGFAETDVRARVLYAQSIENSNLPEAIEIWTQHLEASPDDWLSEVRLVALHAQSGALTTAADRAWRLAQKRAADLPSIVLFQSALLQNAASMPEDDRLRRIEHLHEVLEARGRPEDDKLRVSLWMHLQTRSALPASDLRAFAKPTEPSSARDNLAQADLQRELRARLAKLYEWGHISLEVASSALADDPAQLVMQLGDDVTLTLGEPPDASQSSDALAGYKEVHLGLLELLALCRLSLLPQLTERLGAAMQLRVFEDVPANLLQIVLELSLERPGERVLQSTRLLAATETGHATVTDSRDGAHWVSLAGESDEVDLATFLACLRDSGLLSVNTYTRASAGLPEPQQDRNLTTPIGLRVSALRWLVERDLLAIVSRALGKQLRLLGSDVVELSSSITRAERRSAALALATEVHSWLGAQQLIGNAVLCPRPPITLPGIRPNAIDAQLASVAVALSAKELLVAAPERCLVALEPFVRDLFSSSAFLPKSLHAFEWTPPLYRATRQRYASSAKRVYGLAWLATQLAPARASELTEELLAWGDSSAFSASSLLQLAGDYPTLAGRASRILALQEAALSEPRHAQHPATHFALAKVEGAFLQLTLQRLGVDAVHECWRALLARWNDVSAPQKVWLLGFVMSGLVDSASSAFAPIPGTDRFRMSPNSTVDSATRALVEWSTHESRDIVGHVVTELLLTIDAERNGAPNTVDLTPIVMLLGNAQPPSGLLSLSHSWMEPLVILSSTWPESPLPHMFERIGLPDGEMLQIPLSELLARAVTLTEEKPKEVVFGLTGVRFKWPVSQTHHIEAEVPLEAVLLSTKPTVTKALGLEVASKVGRFDGALYELLRQLATDPSDPERRRAFARRAVASPMRLVRRMPGMVAYWGMPFALPSAINMTDLEELRTLLSEPPRPSNKSATNRLFEYAETHWKDRPDLATIAGQSARYPGVMGWQWARRAIELDDEGELSRAEWLLTHPDMAHFGELWWSVATQWLRAAGDKDLDARQRFADSIDRVLDHLVRASERGRLEAKALSCMRGVIARLGASGNDALWLTYRLFGWWFAIAVEHQVELEALLTEVAKGRQPTQFPVRDDAAEPSRWADAFDVRLSSFLNALAVCPDLITHSLKEDGKPPWSTPLSSTSIETLIECASADIGDEPDSSDAMDWVPPLRVSTAALAAIFRNGGKFSQLPAQIREQWLSWIPMTPDEDRRRPRTVVLQLIHFAILELGALPALEGALLADRCLRSTAPNVKESPITAVGIAHAAGRKLVSLDDALDRAMPHLEDTEIGRALVTVYLDSVLDVAPETARSRALTVLQKLGRDVSNDTLASVVRTEPSFDNQEPVRQRLVAQLARPIEGHKATIAWTPALLITLGVALISVLGYFAFLRLL